MKRLFLTLLLSCSLPAGLVGQGGGSIPVVQPGDRVELLVWQNPDLSGTFTVAMDSSLQHPLYSEVKVAGVPIPVARDRMDVFLRRLQTNPRFSLDPLYRVYVGGAVRDQNQHYLAPITVGQAISQAGGSTAPNRTHRVRLVREGNHTVVNLNDSEAAELLQLPIRSGDQIVVEDRPSFNRTYLQPGLQALQVVGSLISTFVLLDAVFGSD